jgi:hypothetical protein
MPSRAARLAEVAASMNLFAKEVLPQFRRRDNMRAMWNWLRLGVGFTLKRPSPEGPTRRYRGCRKYSQLVEVTRRGISPHVWKM